NCTFHQLKIIEKKYSFSLSTPLKDFYEEQLNIIFEGSQDIISVPVSYNKWNVKTYQIVYEGIFKQLEEKHEKSGKDDFDSFRSLKTCPVCEGANLKKEALHFKIDNKNISE